MHAVQVHTRSEALFALTPWGQKWTVTPWVRLSEAGTAEWRHEPRLFGGRRRNKAVLQPRPLMGVCVSTESDSATSSDQVQRGYFCKLRIILFVGQTCLAWLWLESARWSVVQSECRELRSMLHRVHFSLLARLQYWRAGIQSGGKELPHAEWQSCGPSNFYGLDLDDTFGLFFYSSYRLIA
jgi:hypothetical protein